MSPVNLPAIAGGTPIRPQPLAYGRHRMDESDVESVVAALHSGTLTGGSGVAAFEDALAARCNYTERLRTQMATQLARGGGSTTMQAPIPATLPSLIRKH